MTIRQHIETKLNPLVGNYFANFLKAPNVKQLLNPHTNYFYEYAVRGAIYGYLQAYILEEQKNWEKYLLLEEQKYPNFPLKEGRADIFYVDPDVGATVIEIKADFKIDSAEDDLTKLLEYINEKNVSAGYQIFCAKLDRVETWEKQLNQSVGNTKTLRAVGIAAVGL